MCNQLGCNLDDGLCSLYKEKIGMDLLIGFVYVSVEQKNLQMHIS